ncbi:MAG: FHA domain-containing protein [Myxococcales bacterium]|jgi:pSer/pThr/pTyr-binding forkhead associated (FHA) protein
MYKLVISDDEGHTTVVPLLRDEITIGRNEGNTIRLTERNVSRRHARLLRRNGSYVVEDLGSYNGVTVNGERVDGKAELKAGDQLGIGDYALAFRSDASIATPPTPSTETKIQPAPRLVVLGEPAPGAEFTLSKSVLRIGRDERLDIWINHKSISHEHAEVQVTDGKVRIYDLGSANGMRVNGIQASRAVLENGDTLELGEVRFRFLPPQGAHSLEPGSEELPATNAPSASRKPAFALGLIALLVLAGAGAVLVTLEGAPDFKARFLAPASDDESPGRTDPFPRPAEPPAPVPNGDPEPKERGIASEMEPTTASNDAPREWEQQLSRAGRALAEGKLDRAFAIADELPADSALRNTPEFGEIRYRYAQAHLSQGQRALEQGDSPRARREAALVLGLPGITDRQRQQARRLERRAKKAQARRIVD